MNRNPAAFPIGPSAGPCNLDWWTQFSGFTNVPVTFPKWVMRIVKAGLNRPIHLGAEYINKLLIWLFLHKLCLTRGEGGCYILQGVTKCTVFCWMTVNI